MAQREARRGEKEKDAQGAKLREIADRVWNGAADPVAAQVPANVRAEKERGERMARVEGSNEAQRTKGASRLRGGAARGRGAGRMRETHKNVSFVIWPTSIGMVPLIFRRTKYLRVCVAL